MNQLSRATSPYLLQHASNPVQWHEWGADALQQARDNNKPILLSIGYSACHWCHVMAHESFADEATAALMNEHFVNIKVDREERPDLDQIYQKAHHMLSQRSGGWPLTVFLTPDDHMPFFAGTYFPKRARHGLPSFGDLLKHLNGVYQNRMPDIREQNASLKEALARLEPSSSNPTSLNLAPWDGLRQQLVQNFDAEYGGFGEAPKFPHPGNLQNLLLLWQRNGDEQARHMACVTLEQMANGGVNDLIGGGFCRYSVDDQWMIPHFEKMLYDNAQLLPLYAEAAALCPRDQTHANTARKTVEWLLREMQAPEGGFYSALDADSEGEEGRFYVWGQDELKDILGDLYPIAAHHWGFDRKANFEGNWHAHIYTPIETVAKKFAAKPSTIHEQINHARDLLFTARAARIRPGLDDKILTAWNGLMIAGLAKAGQLLDQPKWIAAAERANRYLSATHWQDDRLLATSKDGLAHLNAYVDDYAFLLDAQLALLAARWSSIDMKMAIRLADHLLQFFEDEQNGGFYFTSHDHENLILRSRKFSDDATPAGNGIAASALLRLGYLLAEPRYIDAAERTLQAAWDSMTQMPHAHNSLLSALQLAINPPASIVLRGDTASLTKWRRSIPRDRTVYAIPNDAVGLPSGLRNKTAPNKGCLAYHCQGSHCFAPLDSVEQLLERL